MIEDKTKKNRTANREMAVQMGPIYGARKRTGFKGRKTRDP